MLRGEILELAEALDAGIDRAFEVPIATSKALRVSITSVSGAAISAFQSAAST